MSTAEDPGLWGGIVACIGALGAVLRGEHRGRTADKALEKAEAAVADVRKEVTEQLAGKMSTELCGERTKRIEGKIANLDGKTEIGFKTQGKALERIEAAVAKLAEQKGKA